MKELLRPDDTRDALRAAGALLLGMGVLVLSVRKDGPSNFVENDGWGDGTLFFLYLIPAVILYGGAVTSIGDTGELRLQSIGGQDLDAERRHNDLVGWPLLLILLGALAIILSLVRESSQGDQPRRLAETLRGR